MMAYIRYMIAGGLALYECHFMKRIHSVFVCMCACVRFHKGCIERGILVLMIKKIKPPKSN